jgi:hypothetical protein
VLYNGQTREEAFTFPIPKAREINIRKLRVLCAEGLDVQYSKKFCRYDLQDDGTVRVFFEDGTSEVGDVVVGIDGASSAVRQCLINREAVQETLPFALMNFNASYTAEQALFIKNNLHPLVDIAIHPAGHYIRANVLDMPKQDDPSTWTFQILSTWALKNTEDFDNDGDRLKRLKAHVARDGWAEPYKSAIAWIPDDTPILRDQLKIWKTSPWDNKDGRVTLCGDAAHAMTFRTFLSFSSLHFSILANNPRSRTRRKQCLFLSAQSCSGVEVGSSRDSVAEGRNHCLRQEYLGARCERGADLKGAELLHTRLGELY